MAGVLEGKFAHMAVDASCPDVFVKWLAKEGITTIEIYGRLASTEDKIDTNVADVFISDGGELDTVGQSTCVVKLWTACRAALGVDSSGVPAQGMPAQQDGISEGTERTLKASWLKTHQMILPDGSLLSRTVMGKIHRELSSASPYLEVYPLERLRTLACIEPVNTATLLQTQPGRIVEGIEVVSDTVTGNLDIYIYIK